MQECNLRCKYCYGDGGAYQNKGFMNFEVAKKVVDYLVQHSKYISLSISYFGGEPLLNFELIKRVTKYVCEVEKHTRKKIHLGMTTNGVLMDDEKLQFIIENNISVQISMDGIKNVHDANRYYANGNGCYTTVIDRTSRLRELSKVSCRATVTHEGLNILENFHHLANLNFKSVMFVPADNLLSDQDYITMTQALKDLVDEFELLIAEKNYELASKMKFVITGLKRIHTGGN